jgi:hypothetical protein
MNFLNPWGLIGLLSVPVILVLHMLRGRTKEITVSDLGLWSFLEPEVRGKKFQKIPLTWLLIIDILIAILISLALAQPKLLITSSIRGAQHKIVLIDHSLSMQADDVLPNRQIQANLSAIKLISEAGPQDIISVIAFADKPFLIGDTREIGVQDLIKNISSYDKMRNGHALMDAILLANTLIDEIPAHFYIVSDHAFSSPDLSEFTFPITWMKIGDSTNNQAVINLAVDWINENQLQVFARISNFGDNGVRRMVALLVDGEPYDSQNLFLPVRKEVDLVWQLVSKPENVCVNILGNDNLELDDQRCLGLSNQSKKKVIFVCDNCQRDQVSLKKLPIYQALMAMPNLDVTVMVPEEYSPLMKSDWTVFQNSTPDQWPENLSTVFISPESLSTPQNTLIPINGKEFLIDQNHVLEKKENDIIFTNLDFTGLRWGNSIELPNELTGFDPILTADNKPIIMRNNNIQSLVYLFFSDFSSGNLTHHPIFPLLFTNLERLARASNLPHEIDLGEELFLPDVGNYQSLEIITPKDEWIRFTQNWTQEFTNTKIPGLYQLVFEDYDGTLSVNYLGVNAGSEVESDFLIYPREDLEGNQLSFDDQINLQGIDLVPWLLGLAVILLLIEAILSWR